MNNDSSLDESFSNFFESLPTGSEPNSIFYKKYVSLSNISPDLIQIRVGFIYLLNKLIEDSLAIIDISLPLGQSYIIDQIRTFKSYLLYSTKFNSFNESLVVTEISDDYDKVVVKFDTVKASTESNNMTNTMFYQAFEQLHKKADKIFRHSNEQLWQAKLIGMHSIDQGGPYRDSITRICSDICSSLLPLFILIIFMCT